MLTFFLNFGFVRFFKSGLLLDFFFKRQVYIVMRYCFFQFAIIFSEKYLIETLFFKANKVVPLVNLITQFWATEFSYLYLTFIIVGGVCLSILYLI